MAEVKWIKLSTTIFDDEKIRLIEDLPQGEAFLVLWLKLLCLAGRKNAGGEIFVTESVPFTEEMLAGLWHCKTVLVRSALKTFTQLEMIEINEQQKILVRNWSKHQNVPSLDLIGRREKDRQRKQKSRQKSLPDVTGQSRDLSRDKNVTGSDASRDSHGKCHTSPHSPPHTPPLYSPLGEKEGEEDPPTVPQRGQASEPDSISDRDEAKRLICQLILGGKNPDRPWSYEAESALARLLPIPLREIKLIAWFHGLEADDAVHEIKVRRRSEATLLSNWSDEVTRATGFRKKNHAISPPNSRKKEPPRWREFYRWHNSNPEMVFPASFWDLPESERKNYDRDFENFAAAVLVEGVA